jgi:tetratricopeptide (TPR) repeat protein
LIPTFPFPAFRTGLLAGACLLLGAGSPSGGDHALFQRYFASSSRIGQASRALEARHFEEAGRHLDACLHLVPDHFEVHFLLARMAYESRDYAGVLAHLDVSERSLADLDRRYREELAEQRAQADFDQSAMESSLNELSGRVAFNGCSGFILQIKQSAIDVLESQKGNLYQRENPFGVNAEHRFLRGLALYRLGRRDEALAQFRLAVQADPTHARAWNNLISLQWEARDYPQARADLERATVAGVAIAPGLKEAVFAAAAMPPDPTR